MRRNNALFAGLLPVLMDLIWACSASPQPAETSRFDVVSIKHHDPKVLNHRTTVKPNGIEYVGVTLFECIKAAFALSDFELLEASSDTVVASRYDIVAKSERSVDSKELRAMLRNMLVDRFSLRVHREPKEARVYELRLRAHSPKLVQSPTQGDSVQRIVQNGIEFKRTSLGELAEFLAGLESVNHPVIDKTGLKGRFDFILTLSNVPGGPELGNEHAVFAWEAIYADIKQVGLELKRARGVIDFLVVDHVGKPAQN